MYAFKRVRIDGRLWVVSRMLFVVAPNSLDEFNKNLNNLKKHNNVYVYLHMYVCTQRVRVVCLLRCGLRGGTYVLYFRREMNET